MSADIAAAGNAEFRGCEVQGPTHIRAAALTVGAIETYKRTEAKAALEWLSVRFAPTLSALHDDLSLGPAQIKLRTAKKFVAMPDESIASKLLSDPCWSLQLAATILSERMARCQTAATAKTCAVAAAATYNGQKKLSGPNVAYRVVFLHVYDQYADAR
jgi:hypothetical protein